MDKLANIPYAQIREGDTAFYKRTLTERDLILFASVSGDCNPIHLDRDFASESRFGERVGHGMWVGSLISAALATVMPGPGGIYRSQELKFLVPVKIGDALTVKLEVLSKCARTRGVTIATIVVNQHDQCVVRGKAVVIPEEGAVTVDSFQLPEVAIKAEEAVQG
ncbi:MAG: MaoC family dehydratase [Kistimonas sp.]|nr:MaoC family dehydratase [Kistimonas sp.]